MNLRTCKPQYPYDFICDRRSPVGNQSVLTTESDRDKVCDEYEIHFEEMMQSQNPFSYYIVQILNALLKYGKVRLFCWCAPKRCHTETIKRYLSEFIDGPKTAQNR